MLSKLARQNKSPSSSNTSSFPGYDVKIKHYSGEPGTLESFKCQIKLLQSFFKWSDFQTYTYAVEQLDPPASINFLHYVRLCPISSDDLFDCLHKVFDKPEGKPFSDEYASILAFQCMLEHQKNPNINNLEETPNQTPSDNKLTSINDFVNQDISESPNISVSSSNSENIHVDNSYNKINDSSPHTEDNNNNISNSHHNLQSKNHYSQQDGNHITLNIIGPIDNLHILSIFNKNSFHLQLYPLKSISISNLCNKLSQYISTHGSIMQIHSDLREIFTSKSFNKFASQNSIQLTQSFAIHPHSFGINQDINYSIYNSIYSLMQQGFNVFKSVHILMMTHNCRIPPTASNHQHDKNRKSKSSTHYLLFDALYKAMIELRKINNQLFHNLLFTQQLLNENPTKKFKYLSKHDQVYISSAFQKSKFYGPYSVIKKIHPSKIIVQRNSNSRPVEIPINKTWIPADFKQQKQENSKIKIITPVSIIPHQNSIQESTPITSVSTVQYNSISTPNNIQNHNDQVYTSFSSNSQVGKFTQTPLCHQVKIKHKYSKRERHLPVNSSIVMATSSKSPDSGIDSPLSTTKSPYYSSLYTPVNQNMHRKSAYTFRRTSLHPYYVFSST